MKLSTHSPSGACTEKRLLMPDEAWSSHHRAFSITWPESMQFMETKEIFTCEKSSTITGFVRNTNMVAVLLFGTSIWPP